MKRITYTVDAAKDLKRHGNVAARLRKAIADYAASPQAHANNVEHMKGGQPSKRIRVGKYRIVFVETDTEIEVLKIGPRGSIYD